MKRWLQALFFLAFSAAVMAQQNEVPNPGFENWTGFVPDGWYVNNPGGNEPISQSTDARSGSFAMRGETLDFFGNPYPPGFWAGSITSQLVPVSSNYDNLTGYYKFSPAGGDTLFITVNIFDVGNNLLGSGYARIFGTHTSYTAFEAPIEYVQSGVADKASIVGVILPEAGQLPAIGTVFLLDDLKFDGAVGIRPIADGQIPGQMELRQNYPNPFNPSTTIEFSLPEATSAKLTIYNMLGEVVATLVDQPMAAGSYRYEWSANNLPSGVYVYQLTAGNVSQSKKLMLTR